MYAKLMSRITESSLMEEDVGVRYCFMMMLAMADPQGYVIGTDVAIARRMNIPVPDFKKFITSLMQPDPDSNSREEDGRRIIESDCERGYYVVNYRKYRDTRDEEQRREYMREYMQKRRGGKPSVNSVNNGKPALANAEGEGEAQAEGEEKTAGRSASRKPARQLSDEDWMVELMADEAYAGIDVRAERAKMVRWCEVNHKQPGRKRLINWLNRIEKPMALPSSSSTPSRVDYNSKDF